MVEQESGIGITAAARDTGLSKETLRMWEKRYGFPEPTRDAAGNRLYTAADIAKLSVLRRALELGLRPGQAVPMPLGTLQSLVESRDARRVRKGALAPECERLLTLVRKGAVLELRRRFLQLNAILGLRSFVLNIARPLIEAVGAQWEPAELDIVEEHLFTEIMQSILRNGTSSISEAGAMPVVVLAIPPGERHTLGLIMVEAMLVLEGAFCISLGGDVPPANLTRLAERNRIDVVALSISSAYPVRSTTKMLDEVRKQLPNTTSLWIGGAGVEQKKLRCEAVSIVQGLEGIPDAVREWRVARLPGVAM